MLLEVPALVPGVTVAVHGLRGVATLPFLSDTVRVSLLQSLGIVPLFAMDGHVVTSIPRGAEAAAPTACIFDSVVGDAVGSVVSLIAFCSINLLVPDMLEATSSLLRAAFSRLCVLGAELMTMWISPLHAIHRRFLVCFF